MYYQQYIIEYNYLSSTLHLTVNNPLSVWLKQRNYYWEDTLHPHNSNDLDKDLNQND